jgi:hypothetical protein
MATAEARFIYLEQRTGLYRTQVAHDAVLGSDETTVLCFDFADIAAQGCGLFESIKELNDDYRTLVAKEELDYEETLERRIVELYAEWLRASLKAVDSYRRIEREYAARGFDTQRVDRLRACCKEAAEILKEDAAWDEIEQTALSSIRIDAVAAYLRSSGEAIRVAAPARGRAGLPSIRRG